MVNFVVLNWIEKFNGSRFIHFKHNDRQIISILFDEVFLDAFKMYLQFTFI